MPFRGGNGDVPLWQEAKTPEEIVQVGEVCLVWIEEGD